MYFKTAFLKIISILRNMFVGRDRGLFCSEGSSQTFDNLTSAFLVLELEPWTTMHGLKTLFWAVESL